MMSLISQLLAEGPRTRSSWNARFEHWERPPSDTEEAQINRAASMVRTALVGNAWLQAENVTIAPQGSYFNNTNVRLESDMDLRAVHPLIRIEYHQGVLVECAQRVHQIPQSGRYFTDVVADMRREVAVAMGAKFGAANIDASGNKAIRIKKLPGSRADVDVVPVFKYLWIWWNERTSQYCKNEGVTILSKNGVWTNNFPDQHYANGVAKRARTAHRFKKQVRIFKRLRDELVGELKLSAGRAPSFFVECLTYAVEDAYFLGDGDDRYERTIRILYRMWELLNDPAWTSTAMEINGIKFLFHASQPWTVEDAKAFVAVAFGQLRV
jgi:hypothetical protein